MEIEGERGERQRSHISSDPRGILATTIKLTFSGSFLSIPLVHIHLKIKLY